MPSPPPPPLFLGQNMAVANVIVFLSTTCMLIASSPQKFIIHFHSHGCFDSDQARRRLISEVKVS